MANKLGIIDEEALNIYTDGSSFPNKKRAAGVGIWFVWVNDEGNEETEGYAPPGWESATIDEMEIKACAIAVHEATRIFENLSSFKRILIFSDSNYVVNNYFSAINVWPKTKWLKANKMPVANIELWKELKKKVSKCPIRVDIEWVKAHKKNLHNREADKLAKKSASLPLNNPISVSETTRKWSARKTKRGCIQMLGQETCIRIISRKFINKVKTNEYRYEIIDSSDKNFMDIDFIYCKTNFSRNKCFKVLFNTDQSTPYIIEVIEELDPADYKY